MKNLFLIIITIFFIQCKDKPNEKDKKVGKQEYMIKKTDVSKTEIEVKELTVSEVPNTIKILKDFVSAKEWKDVEGNNVLVIYRSNIKKSDESIDSENEKDVDFFVVKYTKKDNKYEKIWSIHDYIKNCSFDIYIGLANENSVYITDLDNDGYTEVSVAYYLTCRSDISPSSYKFIIREGDEKYALRGTTILNVYRKDIDLDNFEFDLSKVIKLDDFNEELQTFGRYKNEIDFKTNSVFLKFAKKKWMENMFETEFKQL